MSKYYAGIGNRAISIVEEDLLKRIGWAMGVLGYTLRSGGANGADTAFEEGCLKEDHPAEIYLPWKFFNNRKGDKGNVKYLVPKTREVSSKILKSSRVMPYFDEMSEQSKKFHARNVNQILGTNGVDKVKLVVYCAETDFITDKVVGGTRTAVELAAYLKIPTFNMKDSSERKFFLEVLFKQLSKLNILSEDFWNEKV